MAHYPMKYLLKTTSLFLILLVTSLQVALASDVKDSPSAFYKQLISTINQQLSSNQQAFLEDPQALAAFVDNKLIANWSTEQTVKRLLGKKLWLQLTNRQQLQLQQAFADTLQRYAQEGFSYYKGQKLAFEQLKLSANGDYGLLSVRIYPDVLPDFSVQFKVRKVAEGWKLYDVLVEGISYIRLKRDSVRALVANRGVPTLLAEWRQKNSGYIPSSMSVGRVASNMEQAK